MSILTSVIIPTYKEPDYLDLCVSSCIEGCNDLNAIEIIIVVDGFPEINKEVINKYKEHPQVRFLMFNDNKGLAVSTNWGVYNSRGEYILVVNDDNVFPIGWDKILLDDLNEVEWVHDSKHNDTRPIVISPNQIEPTPSMFKQFIIRDFGKTPEDFDKEAYHDYVAKYRISIRRTNSRLINEAGNTLPFFMERSAYLLVGGWDIMYPSPHVVDWDFFLKCELAGYHMMRSLMAPFYHFAGAATRRTPEHEKRTMELEQQGHKFFELKWGSPAEHNPWNNSKMLSNLKKRL